MTTIEDDPGGSGTATGVMESTARIHVGKIYDVRDRGKVRLGGGYVSFDHPRSTSKVRRLADPGVFGLNESDGAATGLREIGPAFSRLSTI